MKGQLYRHIMCCTLLLLAFEGKNTPIWLMREDEFVDKGYQDLWMKFYELFDVRMTDSDEDLDRARLKLHGLLEVMADILLIKKQKDSGKDTEVFTEKELPSLHFAFASYLEWARSDKFWSKREKSDEEIGRKTKAELIASQEDLIKRIKENEYHTEEELQFAEDALAALKKMRLP